MKGEQALEGSGGVLRYRVWPAKRYPLRSLVVVAVVVGLTALGVVLFSNLFWALLILVAASLTAAPFFFPTEVVLDGATLIVRHLGTPRSYNLREYRRVERARELVPRVELLPRGRLSPLDTVDGVMVPLPADSQAAERVIAHFGRWVGRTPTGRFVVDVDLAPEDAFEGEE